MRTTLSQVQRRFSSGWLFPLAVPPLVAALAAAFTMALSDGECSGAFIEGSSGALSLIFSPHTTLQEGADEGAFLLIFGATKLLLLTPISLILPVPTGAFLPTFVSGAALGHLIGELLISSFPTALAGERLGPNHGVVGSG